MGSFEFRPDKTPAAAADGKLAPRVESQLNSQTAINHAHQFFHTGAEAHALAHPPILPGAHEPISPLIQLIMRLPGHVGIFNSFFEALQSLIMPHLNFLPHLDPSFLAAHAHEAANAVIGTAGGHVPIDLSLLPADAHIFQTLQLDGSALTPGHMHMHLSGADLSKHSMQVSGTPDVDKPLYEGGGQAAMSAPQAGAPKGDGALAGPALSDHGLSNHLAGVHRIFSHSLFERPASAMNSSLTASNQTPPNPAVNQANALSAGQYTSNSNLHVNGTPFARPSAAPAAGESGMDVYRPALNAGFHIGAPSDPTLTGASQLGPSGAVSDQLGGRHVLASNDAGVETFRPTLGGDSGSYSSSASQDTPLTGMRAEQLTLDGGGKIAHSSAASHFHSASGDVNTNGQSHLHQVRKPLSEVKDQIAHRGGKSLASSSASHQIAALPKHSNPTEHVFKPGKQATTLPKETATNSDSTQTAASDRPSDYTIRSGDCLWNIAKNQLGDAKQWQEIYKLNMDSLGSNPDLIHPGTTIHLPNASQDLASHGMTASKYVVRAGDNLWNISKHLMGSGDKWGQLYHLNSDVIGSNPRLILPGQELSLPGHDVVASNGAAPISDAAGMQQPLDNHVAQGVTAPQSSMAQPAANAAQPTVSDAPVAVSGEAVSAPAPEAPQSVLSGPGGAQAATITPQPSQNDPSVVSQNLAPDLSFFTKPKR